MLKVSFLLVHVQSNSIQTIRPLWPNSLCRLFMNQKLSSWTGVTVLKIERFFVWTFNMISYSVVALSAPSKRQSLMVPTEICEYKRKLYIYRVPLYMYRVPEFRIILTFTNYEPLKRSADLVYWVRIPPASEFVILQTVLQCTQNIIIVLIICIFFLTFLEPLIHDSEYCDKRK